MLYAIVAVIILILDQGLKYWTTLNLTLDVGQHQLIPGLVRLTNIHNYGAAFSILQNTRWLLVIITAIFVVVVAILLSMEIIEGRFGQWMAVLVLAGAIGNGIDRIIHGYVVDMFQFEFMPTFPVFNVADIFITVCGILFCIYLLFHKSDETEKSVVSEIGSGVSSLVEKVKAKKSEDGKPADAPAVSAKRTARPEKRTRLTRDEIHQKFSAASDNADGFSDNPFAEWEFPPASEVSDEPISEPASESADEPAGKPVPESSNTQDDIPSASESDGESADLPAVSGEEAQAESPAENSDIDSELSFSLDDILAEFRDNNDL